MLFVPTLITFFAFLSIAAAAPTHIGVYEPGVAKRMTNAERFARGLPPGSPVFKRVVPGKRESELPTRAFEKRTAAPSSIPVTYTGKIQVRKLDGTSLGFVFNEAQGVDGVNSGGPSLGVTITTTTTGTTPFDIIPQSPAFPKPWFIGASGSKIEDGLTFGHVTQTVPGSVPSQGGESAIWFINANTKEITAQWIDPDGSKPTTIFGVNNNGLFLTNDISNYNNAHHGAPISQVKFFLV